MKIPLYHRYARMCRGNYVCFKHRTSSRGSHICPVCKQQMTYIGYRWRVPRKTADDQWKFLERVTRRKGVSIGN